MYRVGLVGGKNTLESDDSKSPRVGQLKSWYEGAQVRTREIALSKLAA